MPLGGPSASSNHLTMRTRTCFTSGVPRLAVLTLTINVPDAGTPQPNCRRNGSELELPGAMTRPLNDDIPGIGIGGEVGSGTGTEKAAVLEVEISVGTLRWPKRSRNSNPTPLTISSPSARKRSVSPAWNGEAVKQNGPDRKTGRMTAGSTVITVLRPGVSVYGPVK